MNLAALFFDVARRLPDRRAVSDDRQSWNYGELAERIARAAGGLRAYGLVPGDRVLLSLENCGEFFELLFGCWAAGLCAVPTNARLHPREVEYIAENSGARLLVATPALAEALAPLESSVASLDRVIATRSGAYDALFAAEPLYPEAVLPTDRAWLFYTSGTTGRPIGAVLTHRNLLFASQCYYADIDQLDERDTHLLAAPVSHGVINILLGIIGGMVGGWLFERFGETGITGFNVWSMFVAVIGAIVVLVVYHLIRRIAQE